ncbi:hypothetical protein [Sphingomonas endolithica]|uniref:hypothetical protein n=1 Tax=Sphingomonas endolithica TaxID=2972485 RepID=UPI0021B081E3|nr:hypothetical protein [Sphingomonas sp. ZFBP2030]
MGAVIYPIARGPVRALVLLQVTDDRWQVADYGRACPTGRRARWHKEGLPFYHAQSVAVTAFRRFGMPICIKRLGMPYRPYRPGGAA